MATIIISFDTPMLSIENASILVTAEIGFLEEPLLMTHWKIFVNAYGRW
jgi:hypothetical protein